MVEFYQWATNNFFSFVAVTGVLVSAVVVIVSVAKGEK